MARVYTRYGVTDTTTGEIVSFKRRPRRWGVRRYDPRNDAILALLILCAFLAGLAL